MAGIIFGCIMLILVGWAILKGKYAPFILFASGVAMLLFSVVFDTGSFMPKKEATTSTLSSFFATRSRTTSRTWASSS